MKEAIPVQAPSTEAEVVPDTKPEQPMGQKAAKLH
jgi:hypothetical protein